MKEGEKRRKGLDREERGVTTLYKERNRKIDRVGGDTVTQKYTKRDR